MSDVKDFVKLLVRYRYLIIVLPLITVVITYFLVRKLPDVYVSKARIATGIADPSESLLSEGAESSKAEIDQKFANIMQMIVLKKIMDQVSYLLIINELSAPKPFKLPSKLLSGLRKEAKQHALAVYKEKYSKSEELSLQDPDQKGLYEVIKSMGYDNESIASKLTITRANNSDYIDVKFESESPELCAFVANNLCKEFIAFNNSIVKNNQNKAVDFLSILLQRKLDTLNNRMQELKDYKTQNRILYLGEQARALFSQITDYEVLKETAEKEITSYTAAIKDINDKFSTKDRQYLEASLSGINGDIVQTKSQIRIMSDLYVNSNFKDSYKRSIDSLQKVLEAQVLNSTNDYIFNPLVLKQDLISKKLNMEIALDLNKNSVKSLEAELKKLNDKFDNLVPHEAVIQANEMAIDVASKEYLEILNKFNQTTMATNYSESIRQIEVAMPGSPGPSKKMLLVIISGIVSAVFCFVILFVIFYLDDTIKRPLQLATKTGSTVIGYLPFIKTPISDLLHAWNQEDLSQSMIEFKSQLRAIRFEIDLEMTGFKRIAITSIKKGEGKTMVALGLAYAYSLTNKKVLLIDGDFSNSAISKAIQPEYYLENLLDQENETVGIKGNKGITLLANKGNDLSLLELCDEKRIREVFDSLDSIFDIVIIETPSLDKLNKAGEWILVSDKILAVFEATINVSKQRQQYVEFLKTFNGKFIGWILNKVVTGDAKTKKKKRKPDTATV